MFTTNVTNTAACVIYFHEVQQQIFEPIASLAHRQRMKAIVKLLANSTKLDNVTVNGTVTSCTDVMGALIRISAFASGEVRNKFHNFAKPQIQGEHQMQQVLVLAALLFQKHYEPNAEWDMDDYVQLWDEAIESLLENYTEPFEIENE